jgi:hypothetical protein
MNTTEITTEIFRSGWAIAEFSRNNCVSICAFLVPANLIISLQTLIFLALDYSQLRLQLMAFFAFVYAIAIIFHVISWFMAGIVMAPTFILLALGIVCLSINYAAIAHRIFFRRHLLKFTDLAIDLFVWSSINSQAPFNLEKFIKP